MPGFSFPSPADRLAQTETEAEQRGPLSGAFDGVGSAKPRREMPNKIEEYTSQAWRGGARPRGEPGPIKAHYFQGYHLLPNRVEIAAYLLVNNKKDTSRI